MSNFKCQKCNFEFNTKSGLWKHNNNKHIIKNIIENKCKYCNKILSDRFSRWKHETKTCKKNPDLIKNKPNLNNISFNKDKIEFKDRHNIIKKLDDIENKMNQNHPINEQLINMIVNKDKIIEELSSESNNKINTENNESISDIETDQNKLQNDIIKKQEKQIKILKNLVVKKQKRNEYEDENVIYILTTPENKKNRIYIIGKANNLKNRLSTYNKTVEHEVIYYKSCYNKDDMSIIENMVLAKLKQYREIANRDRFILPIDKNISFFKEIIDNSINFINI
uniref:C2H2-type domain-containing protein n=1 Tax=viral metagenome TaxID=1070528 RepID=A0A6C0HV01_9ZZZZ